MPPSKTELSTYSQVFFNDGLSHSEAHRRYKSRRRKLAKSVGHICVISSVDHHPFPNLYWANNPVMYYQEPAMLYLTGINQPHCVLVLVPDGKTVHDYLYVPPKDPKKEFWEGAVLGTGSTTADTAVTAVTGITTIRPLDALTDDLTDYLRHQSGNAIGTIWYSPTNTEKKPIKDGNWQLKTTLNRRLGSKIPTLKWHNINDTLFAQRLILDATDIANMKTAAKITGNAFKTVLNTITTAKSETQVAGMLEGEILKRTPFRTSFPSIVASGKNAAVLHYTKNNDPIKKGQLLLLDFGARYHSVCADVSRTIPVSGSFNPLQKLLYNIVLSAQKKVEAKVKAGVTIDELNTLCWSTIEAQLDQKFTQKGGKMTRAYTTQPHNVSHLIGIAVHDGDPFRNYRHSPLKAGMVISNEPGLYGKFSLKIDGKTYTEELGIRIEDDLLITKTGCENLTHAIPK